MNNSVVYDYTKGFKFYLHERGQFWRGIEMDSIGQTQAILIPTRSEVWGTFRAVKKTNLADVPKADLIKALMEQLAKEDI